MADHTHSFPAPKGSPMPDLTAFQLDLMLAVLRCDGQPHGAGLKKYLQEAGYSEVHHGRLYPNMDTLVEKGFIEKEQKDRRTNAYAATPRGRREMAAYRNWVCGFDFNTD